MERKILTLSQFLKWSSRMAGKPITFVIALFFVMIWTIIGFFVGFSNTWLLIINTIATINAFLMVFIIQNTQNRESKALHLKIDELIMSIQEAENELVAIEEFEEEEIEKIKKQLAHKKATAKKRKSKEI